MAAGRRAITAQRSRPMAFGDDLRQARLDAGAKAAAAHEQIGEAVEQAVVDGGASGRHRKSP